MKDEWTKARAEYIRGLKTPSDQQRLLLLLSDKNEQSNEDKRKLAALVRAEKAAERALKAKASASRIVNADKEATRKSRDRELYNAAGLLILSGLVDSKLGQPIIDKGELLGALLGLSKVPKDDPRRAEWKRAGDALLAEKSKR
jgi:hypothetical protein